MTSFSELPRQVLSVVWRVVLSGLLLGGLLLAATTIPTPENISDPPTLAIRVLTGIVISALTFAWVRLVGRKADAKGMSEWGVTSLRTGWQLVGWGLLCWTVPAAATFGALAVFDTRLSIAVPGADFALTVALLVLAVLFTEAIPEELIFRGYITTVLGTVVRGWGIVIIQGLLFTLFAALLRQNWNPIDLSLFLAMGMLFGYFRMLTGSIWMSIGFHAAFQTGSQLLLTHDGLDFTGEAGTAMLALGIVPFAATAFLLSSTRFSNIVRESTVTLR